MTVGIVAETGEALVEHTYGLFLKPWRDVSKFIRDGDNTIHIVIDNAGGGPCGGTLQARIDGKLYAPPNWKWHRPYATHTGHCFDETVVLHVP